VRGSDSRLPVRIGIIGWLHVLVWVMERLCRIVVWCGKTTVRYWVCGGGIMVGGHGVPELLELITRLKTELSRWSQERICQRHPIL
jgi:hypothetical protein